GGRRRLVAMLAPTGRRACGHSVYKSIIWSNVVKRNLLFAATALALALSFSACSQQSTAAEEAASARSEERRVGKEWRARWRHTRFSRDWSSDVCSSDLGWQAPPGRYAGADRTPRLRSFRLQINHLEQCSEEKSPVCGDRTGAGAVVFGLQPAVDRRRGGSQR